MTSRSHSPGFRSVRLYYFSGTGNAHATARWIGRQAESAGIPSTLIPIAEMENRKVTGVPADTLIGFCGPTHGFNYPPLMLHFIFRFASGRGNPAFVVNTRAGMKAGRRFLPGISGVALLLPALVLRLKGYGIRGMRSVDLPSNWISLHPGIRTGVVNSIIARRKRDVEEFAGRILTGRKMLRSLRDLPLDLLVTPLALLYYIFARFVFAKTFIASSKCTHCGLCVDKCPVNAIRVVDDRCFWTHRCESCMQCMNSCPERAIETAHGFIIGVSILLYSGLLAWLHNYCQIPERMEQLMSAGLTRFLVFAMNSLIYLLLIFLFYRIMHFLMRFRLFERMMVLSSLTFYRFWRRYRPSREQWH